MTATDLVDPSPAGAGPAVRIRTAAPGDLGSTARLHRRRLPGGFFARLGPRFLARYHATFAASPEAILLVAEQDDEVTGFLAGTVDNADHYRFVLRRRAIGMLTSGLAALVRDRRLAREFVRTRAGRYARAVLRQVRRRTDAAVASTRPRSPRPAAGPSPEVVAVLTHVAVETDAAGSGHGRALVERFVAAAAAAGASEARLVTAAGGAAAAFYRRLGWRSRGERRGADGTVVEEFVRPL